MTPRKPQTEAEAAEASFKAAEAARDAARNAEFQAAWTEMRHGKPGYRPPVLIDETPSSAIDPQAAVLLAVRHLGGRPPASPGAMLADLSAALAWTPDKLAQRLHDLSHSHRAQNLLARVAVQTERDVSLIVAGLLLGGVTL